LRRLFAGVVWILLLGGPVCLYSSLLSLLAHFSANLGKFTPPLVQPGDAVLLSDYKGDEVQLNNESFLLVREEDILATLEEVDVKPVRTAPDDLPDLRDLPRF